MLEESRLAMYDALSYTRTHNPGLVVTGRYNPNNGSTIVERPSGPYFKTMGQQDSRGHMHLLPEETLYLVERGSLDLRWTGVEELEDLPVSLQAAYTYMIGSQGLTLERYTVYTGLRRNGFIVRRAPTWYPEDHDKVSDWSGKGHIVCNEDDRSTTDDFASESVLDNPLCCVHIQSRKDVIQEDDFRWRIECSSKSYACLAG